MLAGLRAFLDASPEPTHAVTAAAALLDDAGFVGQPFAEALGPGPLRRYVTDRGSLIAWQHGPGVRGATRLRVVAAHTDSPGFRIKPHPETIAAGCVRLGVEVYGGPLLNSWLDRDLGLAGSVLVSTDEGSIPRPVRDDRAVVRIPQLAIHLDRGVNEHGLKLDRQEHLPLLWSIDADADAGTFVDYVARLAGVTPDALQGWNLAPFDIEPARICGIRDDLLASGRLDDLFSCHGALQGLIAAEPSDDAIDVVVLVDHEEVGSRSGTGAEGRWVANLIERITHSVGADRSEWLTTLANSHAISLDMAHATHPNHAARHDPSHPIRLGGGPVVKHNAQQRYATDLASTAPFLAACDAAGVPVQHFVSHSEIPCGSTIGPALASGLGIPVVDVGVAQLAMHSIREMCATADHGLLVQAVTGYFSNR